LRGVSLEQRDEAPEKRPTLRLLILCAGDPEAERTFSGSARSLFHALEARDVVHHKGNVAGYTDPFVSGNAPIRVLRKLDRFGLESRYRWSRVAFARNTRRAHAVAAAHPGFNAVLMYGTSFLPQLNVPVYCYFDATVAQVARAKAWAFRRFSERKAAQLIAQQKRVFDMCTGIFPRSRWAAQSVVEDYGVAPGKVVVASAGANHTAEPLPHGPYDAQTILFVGRDFERKGGPLILEAFRLVRACMPRARLIIVGCRPPIEEDGVDIVGRISKDVPGGLRRLLELYSRASLFCIMSELEPFGIVIVEAQTCYVPCVVPARFAFTETVVDGLTGRHVKRDEPALLAAVFMELLGDPARLERMGQAAHHYVLENYTWEIAAQRVHDRILQDLLVAEQSVHA